MSMSLRDVLVKVSSSVIELDNARKDEDKPADYSTLKEAMYELHIDWQELIRRVRERQDMTVISGAAVRLASASIKLATDLSNNTQDIDV